MLKIAIAAIAVTVMFGVLPAAAQNFTGSCSEYCAKKACATATSKNWCIQDCSAKCRMRNPNAKN